MEKLKYKALSMVCISYCFWLTSVSYADVAGTTNTWLDQVITVINQDEGLKNRFDLKDPKKAVTQQDIDAGATAANEMNKILITSIKATWIANDGVINTADTRELNDYIFKNYSSLWKSYHWDDDNAGWETGYHRVQNDGGNTILFWQNALNTVFDGIYHLWFETSKKNKLLNEDGNNNVTFASVGFWLDLLLQNDLKAGTLKNGGIIELKWTTATGLDKIIEYLKTDVWLSQNVKTSDMLSWANAANEMNKILIESFKKTWVTNDGAISEADVRELNLYIVANYAQAWAKWHGDDDNAGGETGFHLVQNDGASKKMFEKNAVNTVFDGIYHLGFPTDNKTRLKNEDGNDNANFKDVAIRLDGLMWDDIRGNSSIKNSAFTGAQVISWDWYMLDSGFKWAYFSANGIAILSNKTVGSGSIFSTKLNVTWDGKIKNGYIIFDYVSPTDFKYVWARVWAGAWVLGQYKDGQYKDLKKIKETLSAQKDYLLQVTFSGKTIILNVDGGEKIKYTLPALVNTKIGLWVDRSSVLFKEISVK